MGGKNKKSVSLISSSYFLIRRLRFRDNRREFPALGGNTLLDFDRDGLVHCRDEILDDLFGQVFVLSLAAAQDHLDADLIVVAEEFLGLRHPGFGVVLADAQRKPDAFDLDLFLFGFFA